MGSHSQQSKWSRGALKWGGLVQITTPVQYPFVMATAMEKMGFMATYCGVHIVMAVEKIWVLSVLSVAVDATVNVSFSCWHWPRTFNQPNAQ